MKLMTKELAAKIPALYAQEHAKDKTVHAKFFDPYGSWTWYVTEYDGEDICFGYVDGHCGEWGYFSIAELESIRFMGQPRIERDLHFSAKPMSEVRNTETMRAAQ